MSNATVPIRPLDPNTSTSDLTPQPIDPRRRHLAPVDPHLRSAPKKRRGALFGSLVSVGIVLAILATQLGLSILVSQGAYEMRALQLEQRDLIRVERVLAQNLDKLSSPQNLTENAAALGMVQNSNPAALRLSDSAVLGDLSMTTRAVTGNLVPNATLEHLPVLDSGGLLVARDGEQAVAIAQEEAAAPVAWEGNLPVPETH